VVYQCSPCHPPHSVPVLAMYYEIHIAFVIWRDVCLRRRRRQHLLLELGSFHPHPPPAAAVSRRRPRRRAAAPASSIHDHSGCQSRHAAGEKSVAWHLVTGYRPPGLWGRWALSGHVSKLRTTAIRHLSLPSSIIIAKYLTTYPCYTVELKDSLTHPHAHSVIQSSPPRRETRLAAPAAATPRRAPPLLSP